MANLLKFFRSTSIPAGALAGAVWFNPANNEIKVYTGTAWEQYSGLVKNVEYSTENKTLTITPFDGAVTSINLDEFVKGYINALDYADTAVAGEYVSKVTQTDGLIAVTREKLPVVDVTAPDGTTIVNSESKKAELSQVTATTIKAAVAECSDNKFATEKAVRSAINALDYNDTAVTGQYVSAVSEVDGVITVTRANLPTESADVDSLDGKTGVITTLKGQTATGAINLEVDEKNQLKATLVGSFENGAQVNQLVGVKLNGTDLAIAKDKTVNVTAIEGIAKNDKILSKNGNNIQSTLSMSYDSKAKKIYLKGIGSETISEIDAADFIKDGMVDKASIVWCTVDAEGKHVPHETEVANSVRCLQIVFNTDAGKEAIHIPLNELTDVYTGAKDEITVSEANVIGLAAKEVKETRGKALTPAHGGVFDVITDVNYDTKGRISEVVTSQVTLPTVADGTKTGSDDYVSVTVNTTAGAVSSVTVNTDSLTTKLTDIQKEIDDNELVTSAALNDLNDRLSALKTGVSSISGDDTDYVNVSAAAADDKGNVALTVTVDKVEATNKTKYPSTGLATDGYVKEQVAAVAATANTAVQNIASKESTIQVTRTENSNDVNLELVWAMF